jgi:hypothetical protein
VQAASPLTLALCADALGTLVRTHEALEPALARALLTLWVWRAQLCAYQERSRAQA